MPIKQPQPLNRFPAIDFEVLQAVADRGRLDITFETDNQAVNTKFRLLRLIKSLEAYKAGEPLTEAAILMTLKLRGSIVTIIRKDQSPEQFAMRAAIDGPSNPFVSADQQEVLNAEEDAANKELEAAGMIRRGPDGKWQDIPVEDWPK